MKKRKPREAPQRLVRRAEVCDRCGGVNTFRVRGKWRNVDYLERSACGRRATRIAVQKGGRA